MTMSRMTNWTKIPDEYDGSYEDTDGAKLFDEPDLCDDGEDE